MSTTAADTAARASMRVEREENMGDRVSGTWQQLGSALWVFLCGFRVSKHDVGVNWRTALRTHQ